MKLGICRILLLSVLTIIALGSWSIGFYFYQLFYAWPVLSEIPPEIWPYVDLKPFLHSTYAMVPLFLSAVAVGAWVVVGAHLLSHSKNLSLQYS